MSMIDVIRKEMMTAMKNKDKERKESLSMLLSALKNAQIDKREDLTEAEGKHNYRKRDQTDKETMDTCPADRTDIIDECKARLAVLEEFAPEQMSEEQIEAEINAVLAELGIDAPTMKDKGKVDEEPDAKSQRKS